MYIVTWSNSMFPFMVFMAAMLSLKTNAQYSTGQGFKLTAIRSTFDVLETSTNMKTLIECCNLCFTKSPPCEGVQFDKETSSCTTLANILRSDSGTSSAWIMVPLSSRNKAKVLLVSGNERNMEIVNLATKQSFVYDFPVIWAQGGPISEEMYYFCGYDDEDDEDNFCATLNIETLETELTGVTTQYQQRAVGKLTKSASKLYYISKHSQLHFSVHSFDRSDHQTRRRTSYLVDWTVHILTDYFVE